MRIKVKSKFREEGEMTPIRMLGRETQEAIEMWVSEFQRIVEKDYSEKEDLHNHVYSHIHDYVKIFRKTPMYQHLGVYLTTINYKRNTHRENQEELRRVLQEVPVYRKVDNIYLDGVFSDDVKLVTIYHYSNEAITSFEKDGGLYPIYNVLKEVSTDKLDIIFDGTPKYLYGALVDYIDEMLLEEYLELYYIPVYVFKRYLNMDLDRRK